MIDLYGKKAGEIIHLGSNEDYKHSNFYAECLSNGFAPLVEYAPLTKSWFATLADINDVPLHVFTGTIVRTVLNDRDPIHVYDLGCHNRDSVICSVERLMRHHGHKAIIEKLNDTLIIKKVNEWANLVAQIEAIPEVDDLPPGENYAVISMIPDTDDDSYTHEEVRAKIYNTGKKKGFHVSVFRVGDTFKVVFSKNPIVKKTGKPKHPTQPVSAQFRNTINMMAWDVPFPFLNISEANLNKLLHEHPLPCLVKKGNTVTKKSLMVGKHDGKVAVLFKGEPVLTLDATHKTRLTARQQVQIDDTLAAYRGKV